MKKWITIFIIAVIIIGGLFYFYKSNTQNNTSNYEATKTGPTENNTTQQNKEVAKAEEEKRKAEEAQTSQIAQAQAEQAKTQEEAQKAQSEPVEAEEIASFSTKIYTKDSSRQNNITITCSSLNDTDIANGDTFSFCNTVGRASPNKGYEKADIFKDGEKIKGYGGGNCQVSTTLYNAVLEAPGLTVTERHEHSNKVPYIKSGKDAAVAYGRYDFKFVNNSGSTIRIKADNTTDLVTVKLVKLQ